MRLYIEAFTNDSTPWLNVMHLKTADGKVLTLDRDTTQVWKYEKNYASIIWRGVYQWNGEKENYDLPKDIFKGAIVEDIEIEDDAPEDYCFKPVSCSATSFFNDPDNTVIDLGVMEC